MANFDNTCYWDWYRQPSFVIVRQHLIFEVGEMSAQRNLDTLPHTLAPDYMAETNCKQRTESFHAQTSNRISDLICPCCGSNCLHRSRRHNMLERALLNILGAKPYRCDDCDKRFY